MSIRKASEMLGFVLSSEGNPFLFEIGGMLRAAAPARTISPSSRHVKALNPGPIPGGIDNLHYSRAEMAADARRKALTDRSANPLHQISLLFSN